MNKIIEKFIRVIAVSLILLSSVLQGVPLYAVSQSQQNVSVTQTANLSVNPINQGDTKISGKGGQSSTIDIYDQNGSNIGTGTVNETGSYSITISQSLVNGQKIAIYQTDANGVETQLNVVVGGTLIPVINPISVSDQNITGLGTPNAEINVVNQNGTEIANQSVSKDGTFTAANSVEIKANDTLTITQSDLANNVSESVSVTVGAAINAPVVMPVSTNDTMVKGPINGAISGSTINVYNENNEIISNTLVGTDGTYFANIGQQQQGTILYISQTNTSGTESAKTQVIVGGTSTPSVQPVYTNATVISGYATPNAQVFAKFGNNSEVSAQANSSGYFEIAIPSGVTVAAGDKVQVYQIDGVDAAKSNKSEINTVTVVEQFSVAVNPINGNDTTIAVKAPATATIEIKNSNNEIIGTATSVNSDVNTDVKLDHTVNDGEKLTITVNYNGSIATPINVIVGGTKNAPTKNYVNDGDKVITAEPNSAMPGTTIIVEDASGVQLGETTVETDGSYTVDIPKQTNGNEVSVMQTDGAGNESPANKQVVGKAITNMDLDPITKNDSSLTGKATPGATISVSYRNGAFVGETTVDGSGNFSVPTGTNPTSTVFSVTQTLGGETQSTDIVVDGSSYPTGKITVAAGESVIYADIGTVVENGRVFGFVLQPDYTFKQVGVTSVGQNGQFNISTPTHMNKNDEVICVATEDLAGNFSEPSCTTVGAVNKAPDVNPVNNGATTVTGGQGYSYTTAHLKVYDEDGNVIGTGTSNYDGSYSVTLSRSVSTGEKLSVTQTSGGNPESTPTYVVVGATEKAPLVNPVAVTDTTVSGPQNAAVKNAGIYVRDAGGNIIGEGFVDNNGSYSVNVNRALVADEVLSVTQHDLAGHESPATNVTVGATLDAPLVNPVNNTDMFVTGPNGAAKPGSTVRVYEGSTLLGFVTADNNGAYAVQITPQTTGDVLSVTQSGASGNESPATNVIVGVSYQGPKVDAANSGDNTVHGKDGSAVKGATIEVKDASGAVISQSNQPTVDANGAYSVQTTRPLVHGETIYVTQGDGNSKSPATSVLVGVTQTAPLVNPVKANESHVTGNDNYVLPNAKVIVKNSNHEQIGTATANGNGGYDVNLNAPQPASTVLYVVQADESGNESPETRVVVGSTLAAPGVNPVTANQTAVSGNNAFAVPNATIKVKNESGTVLASGNADGLGGYTVNASTPFTRGQVIYVTQGDDTGESPATKVIVGITDFAPDVNPIKDQAQSVSGDPDGAVPGATISIKDESGYELVQSGQPVVQPDGSYTVQTNRPLVKGETLKVTQGDGQHISPATTVVVGATENGPKVDPISNNESIVKGSGAAAVPGATITINDQNGTNITKASQPVVDGSGSYRVETTRPMTTGERIYVTQSINGETSPATMVIVGISDQNQAPLVDPINDQAQNVTGADGSALPYASIIVYDSQNRIISSANQPEVNPNGGYNVATDRKMQKGEIIYVAQTDGNSISPKTAVVVGASQEAPRVNPVNELQTFVTGEDYYAVPNAKVIVRNEAGQELGTAIADANGRYAVNVGSPQTAGTKLFVSQSDGIHESPATRVIVGASQKAPLVNPVPDKATHVTGPQNAAIVDATIEVKDASQSTVLGTATVQPGGTYDVTTNRPLNAGETIYVTQGDGNGTSPATKVIVGATQNAPLVNPINNNDTTVTGPNGAAIEGSVITVRDASGNLVSTGIANAQGGYTVNANRQMHTGEIYFVTQGDGVNESPATRVVVGSTLAAPKVNPVSSGQTAVTGNDTFAVANATIRVKDAAGNELATGNANGSGGYTVNSSNPFTRGQVIYVTQGDDTGESPATKVIVGVADFAPDVNAIKDQEQTVSGDPQGAVPGATISIKDENNVELVASGQPVVQSDGSYTVQTNRPLVKNETLKVTQTDGNHISPATTVVVGATESGPKVDPISNNDSIVKGTGQAAVPGASITVKDEAGTDITKASQPVVDGNGTYRVETTRPMTTGERIYVTQSINSETSPATMVIVGISDENQAPLVDPINDQAQRVTGANGSALPYASIIVYDSQNNIITSSAQPQVDQNGAYNIGTNRKMQKGETIYVAQTDGNSISPKTAVIVGASQEAPRVNPVNELQTFVTGEDYYAVPNAKVIVRNEAGVQLGTATADANGKYAVNVGSPQVAGTKLFVSQSDGIHESPATRVIVGSSQKAPIVNPVPDKATHVTGPQNAAILDATIEVKDASQSTILGTATVQPGGTYDVTTNRELNAGETIYVTQGDGNGTSPATKVIVGATQNAPLVNPIKNNDTSITGPNGAAIDGSVITVRDASGNLVSTDIANAQGGYTVNAYRQLHTGEIYYVTQGDGVNESPATKVIVGISESTVKVNPIADKAQNVSGNETYAIAGADIIVRDSANNIIVSNGQPQVASNGSYNVTTTKQLNRGDVVYVSQTDGNTESPSTRVVIGGTEKPTIDSINEGDKTVTVHGTPNANVTVTFENGSNVTGIFDQSGTFVANVPANVNLENGDRVTAVANDGINNSETALAIVGAENGVTMEPLFAGDTTIKGTGTPGLTVNIVLPGGQGTRTTTVDTNGNWTYTDSTMQLVKGNPVTATQTDGSTTSLPVTIIVNGTDEPTILPVMQGDTKVRGKGVSSAMVIVTFEDGTQVPAMVDASGSYVVNVPNGVNLEKGDVITAVQTDGISFSNSVSVIVGATQPPGLDETYAGATVVTGTGIPGGIIYVNELSTGTTVDVNGNWSVNVPSNITLKEGDRLSATQNDGLNTSAPTIKTVKSLEKPKVKAINEGDNVASVSGTANTYITATSQSGQQIGNIPVTSTNTYANMNLTRSAIDGEIITFVTTVNGAVSEPVNVVVGATLEAPKVNEVNSGETKVTGSAGAAKNGTNIIVRDGNGTPIGTGKTNADGSYSVDVPMQTTGNKLSVVQEDGAGNISEPTVVIVGIGESAIKVNPINNGDKKVTGNSNAAIPGASIIIYDEQNIPLGTAIVGTNGEFNVSTSREMVRGEIIKVVQTDFNSQSEPAYIVVGGIDKPVIDSVLNTDTLITVHATPNAEVTLTLPGNVTLTQTSSNQGVAQFIVPNNVTLKDGDMITAIASDGQNTSEMAIAIVGAENMVTIDPVFAGDTVITGTGIAGLEVNVTLPNGQGDIQTTTDSNGIWSVENEQMRLFKGDEVTATQTDGVTTSEPATVIVDGTVNPTIDPVANTAKQVTGTGTPNATIYVEFKDGTIVETTVNSEGVYTVNVPSNVILKSGEMVYATQSDRQNVSEKVGVIIGGAEIPVINTVYAGSDIVTGKGTPNATVTSLSGEVSTTVDQSGNFSVAVPSDITLNVDDVIIATQTDGMNISEQGMQVVELLEKPIVKAVNPNDTKVTVEGIAETTIVIENEQGQVIGSSVVANTDQPFDITISEALKTGDVLTVYATHNGAVSEMVYVVVGATIDAPIVDPVNGGDNVVTGEGVPGATIIVTDKDGNVLGTGVVGPNGEYSVDVPTQNAGNELSVWQEDGAGNKSPSTDVIVGINEAQLLVNPINDKDQVVTGNTAAGIANATLIVTDIANNEIGRGTVNVDGSYSVATSRQMTRGEAITVTQTDLNTSSAPVTIIVGGIDTPVIAPVSIDDTEVNVTSTPNVNVTIGFPNTATETIKADQNGATTFAVPNNVTLKNGDIITAVANDGQNNSETAYAVVGAETMVMIDPIHAGDTTITGNAIPNLEVNVTLPNGQGTETTKADSNGEWTVTNPTMNLVRGDEVSATQTDGVTTSAPATVIVDGNMNPTINPVANQDKVVTGTGTPNATVIVKFTSGETVQAKVDPNGNYSANVPNGVVLVSGEKVYATQTDNQNFSEEVSVIIDGALAPEVDTIYAGSTLVDGSGTRNADVLNRKRTVATHVTDSARWDVVVPEDEDLVVGQTVYGMQTDGMNISPETPKEVVLLEKPTVHSVNPNDTQVIVDGTAGTTVVIKDELGNTIGTGLVPTDSENFAITLTADIAMGDVLTVYATHNGAKSEEVHIIVGAALEAPIVDPVNPGDSHVTGEGVPGANITVTDPDGNVLGTGTVDPDGNFDVIVPEQELGNELVVNQEDGAGNTSPDANIVVGGTLPPHINPVSNSHNQITGTGTPNATVILYFENGMETSAKVKPDGTYTADVPNGSSTLIRGELVTARQTDGQNYSPVQRTTRELNINLSDPVAVVIDGADAPAVDVIYAGSTYVTGFGTPKAMVHNPSKTVVTNVKHTEEWIVDVPSNTTLTVGQTVNAHQSDYLNLSPATRTVVQLLEAPIVDPVNPGNTTVVVDGTPGTTVVIEDANGVEIGRALMPTDAQNVAISINKELVIGDAITLYATHNGAVSECVTVIVGATLEGPIVNPVNPGDNSVTGEGVPGANITVTDPDGNVIGEGVVDPDGTFEVAIPPQAPGTELGVTQEDNAGNKSPETNVVVGGIDKPTVNPVNPGQTNVTGTGTPNAEIVIRDENGVIIGTGTVDQDGNYDVTIVPQDSGDKLSVVQGDKAGNYSEPVYVIVGATLEGPIVNPVNPGDNSVTGEGVPGANITVTDPDGNVIGEGVVDPDGTFEVAIPPQAPGTELGVTQEDNAGNKSPETNVVVGGIDKPTVNPVNPGQTNVTGTGTPNAEIVIRDEKGEVIGTGTVKPDGTYDVVIVPQDAGDKLSVVQGDKAGNYSEPVYVIVGATLNPPIVNPVNPGDNSVTGEGTPGAEIIVTDPDGNVIGEGIVNPDGTFEVAIPPQAPGTELGVTQEDNAGNKSPETNVVVGGIEKPTVDPVNPGDTHVTGTGTPNAEIVVRDENGEVIGSGTVKPDGTYDVIITPQDAGDKISVVQGDKAGNYSEPVYVIVGGTLPPKVDPVNPGDEHVTGEGTPGAEITVTDPDGNVIGEGVVGPDGKFDIVIPPAKEGDHYYVTQGDGAGNTSAATEVVVPMLEQPVVATPKPAKPAEKLPHTGESIKEFFVLGMMFIMLALMTLVVQRRRRK